MNTPRILLTVWMAGLALLLCLSAAANSINITGCASPDAIIPDDNLSGLSSTINLSAPASQITGLTLTLDIVGAPTAYNGDYYAYLQFGSGLIVLLNNIDSTLPYGSPGNGMNITLSDGNLNVGAAPYTAGQPLTGTYAPQGGGASTGNSFASTFGGLNPNGAWTLFIADESPGGVGELASWSLDVTAETPSAVPDNVGTLGLLIFGLSPLALWPLRKRRFGPLWS